MLLVAVGNTIFSHPCGALQRLAVQVSELRKDGSAFRRRVPITVEVALIALVTAITSDVEKTWTE